MIRAMHRRQRFTVGLLMVAAVACSADPLPLGGGGETDEIAPAEAAATVLEGRWGDRLGFYATMASLDAGYSGDQVIEHAGTVAADGSIPGVTPAFEPQGALSPTGPNGEPPPGAFGSPGGILGSGRRIPLLADGSTPRDQYVSDLGSWLSDGFDAWSSADSEPDDAPSEDELRLTENILVLTIMLGRVGYSAEQILEALILDGFRVTGPCVWVEGSAGPELPRFLPSRASDEDTGTLDPFAEVCRQAIFVDDGTTTSTTSTTTTTSGALPGGVDGLYLGTVQFNWANQDLSLIESRVEIVVSGTAMQVSLEYTMRYPPRYVEGEAVCWLVIHDTWSGTGTITGTSFEAVIQAGSREILEREGAECGTGPNWKTDVADDVAAEMAAEPDWPFTGTLQDGTLTGGTFQGNMEVVAIRE